MSRAIDALVEKHVFGVDAEPNYFETVHKNPVIKEGDGAAALIRVMSYERYALALKALGEE